MKKTVLQETYPVFALELGKGETNFPSVDAIIDCLAVKVGEHPVARFIAVFDHYEHTCSLADGEIAPAVVAAKNLIFCFGTKLPNPQVLAVRPRAIGVADMGDRFVITFMEAPMPPANQAMESWVLSLRNK